MVFCVVFFKGFLPLSTHIDWVNLFYRCVYNSSSVVRALRFHSKKSCESCFSLSHKYTYYRSLSKTFVLIVIHVWLWHILAQFYAKARTIPTISLSTALNIQFGKLTCGFYTKHKTSLSFFRSFWGIAAASSPSSTSLYGGFIAGIYFHPKWHFF